MTDELPVLYRLRVKRGSADLGMDAGTICEVVEVRRPRSQLDGPTTLTVIVPSLDAMITGLDPDHPDLELVSEQLPLPLKQHPQHPGDEY